MTPEEVRQCLEEAFGGLEPPYFEELSPSIFIGRGLEDAVRTDMARTRPWQELRPLMQYLGESLEVLQLTPKACQYYLPAFLYAMTDPEVVWRYLSPILDTLWYEDEYGDLLFNNTHARDRWDELAALLTDRQKRCITHFLVEVLRTIDDSSAEVGAEVDWERDRIEHMLKKYWNAWL